MAVEPVTGQVYLQVGDRKILLRQFRLTQLRKAWPIIGKVSDLSARRNALEKAMISEGMPVASLSLDIHSAQLGYMLDVICLAVEEIWNSAAKERGEFRQWLDDNITYVETKQIPTVFTELLEWCGLETGAASGEAQPDQEAATAPGTAQSTPLSQPSALQESVQVTGSV